jgi:hypothetical protein
MFVSPAPCAEKGVPGDAADAADVPVLPFASFPAAGVSAALATVVPASATVAMINPDASLLFSRRIIMALLVDGRTVLIFRTMQGLCPDKRLICRRVCGCDRHCSADSM